jgi:hypothetical protein
MTPEHRQEILTTLRDELTAVNDKLRMLRSENRLVR